MSRRQQILQLRKSAPAVLPSLLLCDFGNLEAELHRLEVAGVPALHLDVMDGHFVPNLTYGMPVVAGVRDKTSLPLDVHLMISHPESYVREFCEAGADSITIHAEACDEPREVLEAIRQLGMASGIALNPGTPVERIRSCLDACDLVLIMSVEAGFGGQSFQDVALEKLAAVRQLAPEILLQVDGGINRDTIGRCAGAGAEFFVVGSAIFRQDDYGLAVKDLMERAQASKEVPL